MLWSEVMCFPTCSYGTTCYFVYWSPMGLQLFMNMLYFIYMKTKEKVLENHM